MADNEKEIDFGDYAIVGPVQHNFKKLPGAYWNFNPVTSGSEVARSRFLMHNRVAETFDGVRFEQPPTALEIAHREIALLFGGTNLKNKKKELVLRDDATVVEVEATLAKMPPAMVIELWKAVGEAYPKWGPADPDKWGEDPKETSEPPSKS